MSQRRMFSPQIVGSEEFLTMPVSCRELYFQLGMNADDDGFIQPKITMRLVGATEDDLKVLLTKRFLLSFETGVVVIKHWLIHNLIQKDRYHATRFQDEKKTLYIKENKAYTDSVNRMLPEVRLGKVKKEQVQPTATPLQGLPLASPIGNEISYVSTDEEGNPKPTKVKKTNFEHKARAEHLVELVAMGKQITGKTFPINFGFGVKILKELEVIAKNGDTYAFGWDRVKEEWRALCEEYNSSKFLQEHGFNLGTLKKRITNKGI